jgi:hypothetical protein
VNTQPTKEELANLAERIEREGITSLDDRNYEVLHFALRYAAYNIDVSNLVLQSSKNG